MDTVYACERLHPSYETSYKLMTVSRPVTTYSGQGVTKKGVHANDHTIIYSEEKPFWYDGEYEKGMEKAPIKIKCDRRHKLDKASRLNYAKQYTVEYNVKVWFIGSVEKDFLWQLTTDYNAANPPLQSRGVPPVPAQTFSHAQGGAPLIGFNPYPPATESGSSQWTSTASTQLVSQATQWDNERPHSSRSTSGRGGGGGYSRPPASHDNAGGASGYEEPQASDYTNERAFGSYPAEDEEDDENGDLYSAN